MDVPQEIHDILPPPVGGGSASVLPHQNNWHARKQSLERLNCLLALHLRVQDVSFHNRDRKSHALFFDDCALEFNHQVVSVIDNQAGPRNRWGKPLLFFPYALERGLIRRFHIHKLPGHGIALNPVASRGLGL